jgi:hypothetical protein
MMYEYDQQQELLLNSTGRIDSMEVRKFFGGLLYCPLEEEAMCPERWHGSEQRFSMLKVPFPFVLSLMMMSNH